MIEPTSERRSLVIFGAGASGFCGNISKRHMAVGQFVSQKTTRPPLTADICSHLNSSSSDFGPLVDLLNTEKDKFGRIFDFEQSLRNIWMDRKHSEYWVRMFVDLRQALAQLFRLFSGSRGEYYEKIVMAAYQSKSVSEGTRRIDFLSLNYDSLLKNSALPKGSVSDFGGNIPDSPFSIFQPHGSVDWFWKKKDWNGNNQPKQMRRGGGYSPEMVPATEDEMWIGKTDGNHAFPALAIPMYGDVQAKMCWPKAQEDLLKGHLIDVDKVAVIGWRGADDHIINMLKQNLKDISFLSIADPEKNAFDCLKCKLQNLLSPDAEVRHISKGFSGMFEGGRPVDKLFA